MICTLAKTAGVGMTMRKTFSVCFLGAFLFALILPAVQAQTLTPLYSFNANGSGDPTQFENSGTLSQGQDGSIYTASVSGGAGTYPYPDGAFFSMTTSGALTESFVFTFSNEQGCPYGCNPYSGAEQLPDGSFLVAPLAGGQYGDGTVVHFTPNGSGFNATTLYDFTGGSDGGEPNAAPILGPDGNYYGTTVCGGATPCVNSQGCGTVYQLTPSGTLGWVYQFDGTHGCHSFAPLLLGKDGNFYGTALTGGTCSQCGLVFKITPAGVLTVLHNFNGSDGYEPTAPLIQGTDGNFYGTAVVGIGSNGVIFKMTPAGRLTVLHSLKNDESEGADFYAGLMQATDGNFYGVTAAGGASNWGTIVRVGSKGGTTFSVLYNFDGISAGGLKVPLVQHTNGSFYGFGNNGGAYTYGTFFSFVPTIPLKPFASLVSTSGSVGTTIGILGQGLTGTKKVTFYNLVPATFTVVSDTYITATVPTGATTGFVTVKTATGTLKSSKKFVVTP